MASQEDQGKMLGFAIVAAALMFMFIFVVIVASIAAIGFGIFALIVANWRYKITGIAVGFGFFAILTPLIASIEGPRGGDFLADSANLAILLGALAMPAVGFIISTMVLDFINDQRELPTWEDDLIAWRKKNGFTKGLVEKKPPEMPHQPSKNTFDVPEQDEV